MAKLPILEGHIIRLRPMEIEKDKYNYYDVSLDEKMHNWTGNTVPKTVDEIEALLRVYEKVLNVWMIEEKASNKVIGMMRLSFPEVHNGELVAGDSQRLHSNYWRKGHMKEARQLMYHYAFDTLGVDMLIADALKDNINSCKSLESVGYELYNTKEEFFEKKGENLMKHFYKLTKEKWLSLKV
ncbi:GNAT family N-acetyltransferase [Vallitalea okinawensis]|uniref:GNAT family N-acetyltransferase n=1 Tax=Vallitalea okinawensis TaxID=2078660 RepID=UPI000CFC6855|nr:GNAT family N-acetyltransferase [Vallitalea okinawensis]